MILISKGNYMRLMGKTIRGVLSSLDDKIYHKNSSYEMWEFPFIKTSFILFEFGIDACLI